MSHPPQYTHLKLVTIGILASVLGVTTLGCTASTISTSPPVQSTPTIVASVSPTAMAPSPTPTLETTPTSETKPVSVENAETTPPPIVVDSIEDGRYWIGHTDQGLEVNGDRYRYDTEEGAQPWKAIGDLKYVKRGVVFDGRNYWCLSTLAPKGKISACTAEGWNVAKLATDPDSKSQGSSTEELPFVGTRLFNFEGGSGTGQSITIEADGTTTVKAHGTMQTFIRYTGKFVNPILFEDGFGVRLNGNKIQLVTSDDPTGKHCQSRGSCETSLYQPSRK